MKIGSYTLASYTYTDDRNYYLEALDYGNGDEIQYEYDNKGRITKQTYEDGDTLTYKYNNNGELHSIVDSGAGITTTYYYDLTGRLMKYATTGKRAHTVEYTYDTLNNMTAVKDSYNGTTSYAYDDDNRVTAVTNGATSKTYEYDTLGRLSKSLVKDSGSTVLTLTPTYYAPTTSTTSSRISRYQISGGSYSDSFSYAYNDNGNITSVSSMLFNASYAYDSQNQLIRENNRTANKTWTWEYDSAGNILSKSEYAYTTGTLGTPTSTKTYTYGDSQWGDLLTSYNGTAISYDEVGNMTAYGSTTFTWEHGRQLAAMDTWQFSYDMDGMRLERYDSDTGLKYLYFYSGGQLLSMYVRSDTIDAEFTFRYDANGTPLSAYYFVVTWVDDTMEEYSGTFYYVTNIQGDVVALVDEAGEQLVAYAYDAWGKPIYTYYSEYVNEEGYYEDVYNYASHNPLRYRGYVYDSETGLYYLQSRYYDPEIGRFINADTYFATGQSFVGNNGFAYCLNNPVNMADYDGMDAIYVVDYRLGIGLPIVGHAALYVQDADGNWHYTELAGKKKSEAKVRVVKPDMEELSKMIDGELLWGIEYVYLPGDYTASYEAALEYKGSNYGGYDLFANNCVDYVHELLTKGDCYMPSVNELVSQIDPLIPRAFYYYLKGAMANSVISIVEPTIENKAKEIIKNARRIILFP